MGCVATRDMQPFVVYNGVALPGWALAIRPRRRVRQKTAIREESEVLARRLAMDGFVCRHLLEVNPKSVFAVANVDGLWRASVAEVVEAHCDEGLAFVATSAPTPEGNEQRLPISFRPCEGVLLEAAQRSYLVELTALQVCAMLLRPIGCNRGEDIEVARVFLDVLAQLPNVEVRPDALP